MKQIATALVRAKKAFNPALKNAVNPHLKNKYANLESCLDAVDDALLDNGIFMYQETSEDASGVTVETVFLHESGESLRCGKMHVPAAKNDPQGYGSALTYARRYSLVTACGIAQEDDDGNAASNGKAKAVQRVTPESTLPPAPNPAHAIIDQIIAEANVRDVDPQKKRALSAWLKEPQTVDSAKRMLARMQELPMQGQELELEPALN